MAAKIKLSRRLPKDLTPTPFFEELERTKAQVIESCAAQGGECETPFVDLTVSSPVKAGLPVDLQSAVDVARESFGNWSPDASGWLSARKAVADYYSARGGDFTTDEILLTASTSEAYSILFKTFCDPGDGILTPLPGYPLLDTLAALEHLERSPYFLQFSYEKVQGKGGFRFILDDDSLLSAPENARILLLVSPNHPKGHCISKKEWMQVVAFCEERNLVLVVDEVFGDYALEKESRELKRSYKYVFEDLKRFGRRPKCPIFWLNGLSKAVGSPQLKLGWMAMSIPEEQYEKIHEALEYVEDAFLSVSSMPQALAAPLLQNADSYQQAVLKRTRANWECLQKNFPGKVCPRVLGGWYAVLHLGEDDEELTLRLLREKHVLVQPGFFFDFEEDGWVVISLLQEPDLFAEAVGRLASL